MKYNYEKPNIKINNWLVSQQDIKRILFFFKDRFLITEVPVLLTTYSGNNRQYDTYDEIIADFPKLAADEEKVKRIEILYRSTDSENWHHFKQSWIRIDFGKYGSANWWVIAGDTDGSYKDWVAGTYSEIQRLSALFEVSDQKTIDIIHERFNVGIVFDPSGSIADSIQLQLKDDAKVVPSSLLETLSGGDKSYWWEKVTNNQTFAVVVGGLILLLILYVLYKYSGINLSGFSHSEGVEMIT